MVEATPGSFWVDGTRPCSTWANNEVGENGYTGNPQYGYEKYTGVPPPEGTNGCVGTVGVSCDTICQPYGGCDEKGFNIPTGGITSGGVGPWTREGVELR